MDGRRARALAIVSSHAVAGSIGRTDLPGGDTDQLMESMRSKIMPLDDDVRVLPGHGPETTIGFERLNNPFRTYWR